MGGEIKTFPVHAYIDKSFIQAGMVAQESFSKNNSPTPVSLNIKVGVRIRCADGKYRVAISPPLGIVYSEGKQIKYIQNLNRVSFEYVDVSNPTMWDFEEPKK